MPNDGCILCSDLVRTHTHFCVTETIAYYRSFHRLAVIIDHIIAFRQFSFIQRKLTAAVFRFLVRINGIVRRCLGSSRNSGRRVQLCRFLTHRTARRPAHKHAALRTIRHTRRTRTKTLGHFRRGFLAVHAPCDRVFGRGYRRVAAIQIECLALTNTPDILCQTRIIDKRIPVALQAVNSVHTYALFLAHRIIAMPFQQQVTRQRQELMPVAVRHMIRNGLCLPYSCVAVSHRDIEERTCEITLILIGRTEYFQIIPAGILAVYPNAVVERRVGRYARTAVALTAVC